MDQIKIGKFIAALRKEKNMTQSELAEKLGISNRAVSKWETGIMLELCALLSINVNELLSGERISADEYNAKAEENMIALSKRNSNRSNSGYGIVSILTIIFVVLKLTNNIDWSWVWVLSPIWITLIIGAGLFAIVLIVGKIKKGKW